MTEPTVDVSPDAMVEIARVIAPPEAMTLAAMFDAAGILCHVGGWWHHSIQINAIALGGFRLSVPHAQYDDASALIRDYCAQPIATEPFLAQRKRIYRFLGLAGGAIIMPSMLAMALSDETIPAWAWIAAPLGLAMTPVPPQGSGDYYLASALPA